MDIKQLFNQAYQAALRPIDPIDSMLAEDIRTLIADLNEKCKGLLRFKISDMFTSHDSLTLLCSKDGTTSMTAVKIFIIAGAEGRCLTLSHPFETGRQLFDLSDNAEFEAIEAEIVKKIAKSLAEAEMNEGLAAMMKASFG